MYNLILAAALLGQLPQPQAPVKDLPQPQAPAKVMPYQGSYYQAQTCAGGSCAPTVAVYEASMKVKTKRAGRFRFFRR